MSGRGPMPSNPATRRRRNDATKDFTVLPAEGFTGDFPQLADGYDVDVGFDKELREFITARVTFRPETREWYEDIARSPMATQYLKTDWNHLRWVLAPIFDQHLRAPKKDTAGEIRLQQARLGVTIGDRQERRWIVNKPPAADEADASAAATTTAKRAATKKRTAASDRRKRLTAAPAKTRAKSKSKA